MTSLVFREYPIERRRLFGCLPLRAAFTCPLSAFFFPLCTFFFPLTPYLEGSLSSARGEEKKKKKPRERPTGEIQTSTLSRSRRPPWSPNGCDVILTFSSSRSSIRTHKGGDVWQSCGRLAWLQPRRKRGLNKDKRLPLLSNKAFNPTLGLGLNPRTIPTASRIRDEWPNWAKPLVFGPP